MTKKRITELDMVKGIGIIYVVLRHLCEITAVNTYGEWFFSCFNAYPEAFMFLFVLLSGYVYKSKGSIGADIKNKVKQLLVPYLLFTTFFTFTYFIRYFLTGNMSIQTFGINTLENYLATPNFDLIHWKETVNLMRYAFIPYWYVAQIFMAFLLFVIADHFIGKRHIAIQIVAAIVLIVGAKVLMVFDVQETLLYTYTSGVSYFAVLPNIVGFAGLLFAGKILRHYNIFDIDSYSSFTSKFVFSACLIFYVAQIALYDNSYALQYGKWGQDGVWSVHVTSLTGFALTYCLVYICHFLKKCHPFQTAFSWIGANTMDILLLHYGIAEIVCAIFGFWIPIYDAPYPESSFAWWHFFLVVGLTVVVLAVFFVGKHYWKKWRANRKIKKMAA